MCRDESERVLAIVKALGIKVVIVPHIAPDQQPKDAAGWRAYGKGLAQVAQRYWDAGLGFGYHNHDFEYVRTDTGELPIDLILEGDPRLGLEFDVAWAARVGFDPMETIKKHGPRIFSAHVKDIAPKGGNADEDGWADIGAGTVAWATLLPALRDAGCTYFVMEHDNPNDHRRFATTGIAAAKAL